MVHELMRQLVMWIYLHPTWAGLVLFLLSAGESMTLIGTFIPGTIIMTAVGIFIGADLLSYWPMVLWAACGTLFGDALNFSLGYILKDNIKYVWPFNKRQHWLTKGQHFFEAHGGKSIYFARFIGPLRAFAPIIAGAMRMPAGKFYLIDTLSAFSWAMLYLLPGIILGEVSLELSPEISEHLFRFVFLTLITIIVGAWVIHFLILHISEVIKNALSCLWSKIKETPSLAFIRDWFRHFKADHPRGQLGTAFVFMIVLIAFVTWTLCVYLNRPFITWHNNELHHFTQSLRMPSLDNFMLITTLLGEKEILVIIFCIAFAWMCYQRCWRAAFFFAGTFVLGIISAYALKAGIHFHRPSLAFEKIDGFSYPSGHIVVGTLVYGSLAYLTASQLSMKYRWMVYLVAILLISAIACSRAYLGVHWVSDVVGSILLGWLCVIFIAFFYQRYESQDIQAKKILPVLAILQALLMWGYFQHFHTRLLENYQLNAIHKTTAVQAQVWWKQSNQNIPMMATNRFGVPQELLNVQWAENEGDISRLLTQQGWRSALEKRNWVLEIEHPEEEKIPKVHLIFKKRFLDDKKPRLIFYKAINDTPHTFMVLQLWQTDISVQPPENPLFVGNLSIKTDDRNVTNDISDTRLMAEFTKNLDRAVKIKVLKTQMSLSPKMPLNDMPLILVQQKRATR